MNTHKDKAPYSDNSYIRTRGLLLIAVNAKWDAGNKIDEIIDKYLKCTTDEKPITARRCIKLLPAIVKYRQRLCRESPLIWGVGPPCQGDCGINAARGNKDYKTPGLCSHLSCP